MASRAGASHSQRRRLLQAMAALAAERPYRELTVGDVGGAAGVSRTTFYEYFADREECFAAMLAPLARDLLTALRRAVAAERPERATQAATRALIAFAAARPTAARLMLSDSLDGGRWLMDFRDGLLDAAGAIVEDAHREMAPDALAPDLPPRLICAVACRMLASRLDRDPAPLGELAEALSGWLSAYRLRVAAHGWGELAPLAPAGRSPLLAPTVLSAPGLLAHRPRHLSPHALAEAHWLRVVSATVEVVAREGYDSATVAEITRVAGVDSRVFYALFAGKRESFAAARELLFTHLVAVSARAFVVGDTWPARVSEALRALTGCAADNATLTLVCLLQGAASGADGPGDPGRLLDAFSMFLQEGCRACLADRSSSPPSELELEAIATALFELAYRSARQDGLALLPSLPARMVFVCLAPFLGPQAAHEFLARRAGVSDPQAHTPLPVAAGHDSRRRRAEARRDGERDLGAGRPRRRPVPGAGAGCAESGHPSAG
jgi:AcrR family transcriptional regulator